MKIKYIIRKAQDNAFWSQYRSKFGGILFVSYFVDYDFAESEIMNFIEEDCYIQKVFTNKG